MDNYNYTCSICGKPMSYRYVGMCLECEQIDNDVPERPERNDECDQMPFSLGGTCPCCGSHCFTRGGNFDDTEQQDYCAFCGWEGEPYFA